MNTHKVGTMLKKGFIKPVLSIEQLGKKRLWTGVIMGIVVSIVMSYFFNYSRESLRMMTFMADPHILSDEAFRIYDLFYAALASSIGFGVTMVYWLQGSVESIKKRYLKTLAISNVAMLAITALLVVTRFGTLITILVYGAYGYDGHLVLHQGYWKLLLLFPVIVFLGYWNAIRMLFITGRWFWISMACYIFITLLLSKATSADRDILNQSHYKQNKERFEFIDTEFERARSSDIVLGDSTRQVLRMRYARRITDLVSKVKYAFSSDGLVPLDTLILEKIIIHNMNRRSIYNIPRHKGLDNNWSYALPEEIYWQIMKRDMDSRETEVLFEILSEQIVLFTAPYIEDEWGKHSAYDRGKSHNRWYLMNNTETIQSRLIQVVEKLKSDEKYKRFHHLLPHMEFEANGRRQREINIGEILDSYKNSNLPKLD